MSRYFAATTIPTFSSGNRGRWLDILVLGGGLAVGGVTIYLSVRIWRNVMHISDDDVDLPLSAHEQLIEAGTPLIKLHRISKLIGRSLYVKMESMNPGGTGKDRAALNMIRSAERQGKLPPPISVNTNEDHGNDLFLHASVPIVSTTMETYFSETSTKSNGSASIESKLHAMIAEAMQASTTGGLVVEGTSGSTGIALATLCASRGHACLVVLPDDQAVEKQTILRALGAVVYQVPTAAISNPQHYVNMARKAAQLARDKMGISAVFIDQFENEANFQVHYQSTGPELIKQMPHIDAFCMSSGTGGTIAGIATYLKQHIDPNIRIVLVDPPGSSLYHKIEHGVAYALQQQERNLRKHRYDTIAEGIGLDRVTHNFDLGLNNIDEAVCVSDQQAVDMAHFLLKMEGLWVGSSSAMNVVGAIRTAMQLPQGSNVVTMICDGGQRHATRFWNPKFVQEWGLQWPAKDCIPECLRDVMWGNDTDHV